MFKDKNKIFKVSNGILLAMAILSLVSSTSLFIPLVTGEAATIKNFNYNNYIYDLILMFSYMVFSVLALVVTNKKTDFYKDEYALSHKIFNLFIILSSISALLLIVSTVMGIAFKIPVLNSNTELLTWWDLAATVLAYIPVYIGVYYYVNYKNFLSSKNSKKTNVINFFILYMIMTYIINIILSMFDLIFKPDDIMANIQVLLASFMWIFVVLLAYKLLNTNKSELFNRNSKKEVKVIEHK